MNTKLITSAVVIVVTAALIAYDVWVARNDIPGDTLSEVVMVWAWGFPLIAYAFGMLGGHFFIPGKPWLRIPYSLIGVSAVGLALMIVHYAYIAVPPWAALLVGLPAGWLLWPQKKPSGDS